MGAVSNNSFKSFVYNLGMNTTDINVIKGVDLISIIVPVYNVKQYIKEAVNSLIVQTYKDLEIILIDDGSTDGSEKICDEYQRIDERIIVIHQKNRGLSAARNTGLDICRGEIIAFLDPDDAAHPDMLRRMLKAMDMTGADVVECCYSVYRKGHRLRIADIEKNKCANRRIKRAGLYSKKQAFTIQIRGNRNNACIWNKIYKREIWDNLRFREGMNHEDVEIILPLIEKVNKFCIIDDALVMYRIRPGSISTTHTLKNTIDLSMAYDDYAEYIREHIPEYFCDDDLRSIIVKHYYVMLSRYFLAVLENRPDKRRYLKYLSTIISKLQRSSGVKRFSLGTHIVSFMYDNMPTIVPATIIRIVYCLRVIIT